MAKKLKHFTVTVEKVSTYEFDIDAANEDKAVKLAEKMVKNDEVDAEEEGVEVTDVFEQDEYSDDD